jgi:presenilin-like A22 family membrane protease
MEPSPTTDVAAREETQPAPLPVTRKEIFAVGAMLLMFLSAQFLALILTPSFESANLKGFEDPSDASNGFVLIGVILVFTFIILWIAKKKREKIIQWLILGSVGVTIAYVFFALLFNASWLAGIGDVGEWGTVAGLWILALGMAAVPTWLLYTFPEWYVVDLVGILVSAGAVAIFGTSFTPLTYMVVIFGTAIYDYISVYKTKHMLSLADSVLDLHLPIMLVVPKSKDYSFLDERGTLREAEAPQETKRKPRDAMFIGLGDIVIPSILIVSAYRFIPSSGLPALGALLGVTFGFLFLMSFVLRGKPQAGLPALNGGALLGLLVGTFAAFGHIRFWAV